jgi:tRNA(fMet)-specific endonuclease VapC
VILLDTNICSAAIRGERRVAARLMQYAGQVCIPWMVAAEIKYGLEKLTLAGQPVNALSTRIARLFAVSSGILMATEASLDQYAQLRAQLELAGTPIGPSDLWIASQALAEDAILVTDNLREFSRVPDLRLENWLKP